MGWQCAWPGSTLALQTAACFGGGSGFARAVPAHSKRGFECSLRAAIAVLQPETHVKRVGIGTFHAIQRRDQILKFPVRGSVESGLQGSVRTGGGGQVFQLHIPQGQVYPHTAGGQHLHIGGGFGGKVQIIRQSTIQPVGLAAQDRGQLGGQRVLRLQAALVRAL